MNILIIALLFCVALVLLTGLALMIKGGELNRKYGNKLMVARVTLQAITIAIIGLMFLIHH